MENCIFCKIIKREIPANIIYEDERVLAFMMLIRKPHFHMLVFPKSILKAQTQLQKKTLPLLDTSSQ